MAQEIYLVGKAAVAFALERKEREGCGWDACCAGMTITSEDGEETEDPTYGEMQEMWNVEGYSVSQFVPGDEWEEMLAEVVGELQEAAGEECAAILARPTEQWEMPSELSLPALPRWLQAKVVNQAATTEWCVEVEEDKISVKALCGEQAILKSYLWFNRPAARFAGRKQIVTAACFGRDTAEATIDAVKPRGSQINSQADLRAWVADRFPEETGEFLCEKIHSTFPSPMYGTDWKEFLDSFPWEEAVMEAISFNS